MTALDCGILAFTLALGLWGYRQGLIVGVMTPGRLRHRRRDRQPARAAGAHPGPESPYAPLLAALGALVGGALVAVTLESMAPRAARPG